MGKILNGIVNLFANVGGLYAFYNILYLKYFWKPLFHLNNGKLVCENDGTKTIIIENITAKTKSKTIKLTENDIIHFINNRRMKTRPR